MHRPDRQAVEAWTRLRGVGPATAADLLLLGYTELAQLRGLDPDGIYEALCRKTGVRHDPCCRDVFAMLVDHANGAPLRDWWSFTPERKRRDRSIAG